MILAAAVAVMLAAPQAKGEAIRNCREEINPEKDTVTALAEVAVVARMKQKNDLRQEPLSATVIKLGEIERKQVASLSDMASLTPNLYIPQYGSKMTSSIYVRGLGSRIDHPAVGLYVDNVPFLNKNGFDSDLWDIMRMEVLRGPQSTLYGRNTVGGIISIYTLSPMVYQGVRLQAGYSSGNTYNFKGSVYAKPGEKFAFSIGANYRKSDGFFTNATTGENVDWEEGSSVRARLVYTPTRRLTIDNSFMAGKIGTGDGESLCRYIDKYADESKFVKWCKILSGRRGPFWWDNSIRAGICVCAGVFPISDKSIEEFCEIFTLLSHRRDRFLSFDVTNGIITASPPSTVDLPLFA